MVIGKAAGKEKGKMEMGDRQELLTAMRKKRILVFGDMVADIYLDGRISRISREAPVLVLEQAGERIVAGGAANVVNNVATLGGIAHAVGVVGRDSAAEGLRRVLEGNGVHTGALVTDEGRPTISKTRIIAGGRATVSQQIVRIDRESKEPLSAAMEAALLRRMEGLLPHIDGIVLSDYGAGTVTEQLKERLIRAAREKGIPSIVDSRYAIHRFNGIGYVKQNDAELAAAVHRDLPDEAAIIAAARELCAELAADGVLVTRGEDGMTLVTREGATTIPVTDRSEVFDVSGAGDTCVATVILALAAKAEPAEAARLSNLASGIAVRKMGTSTVSAEELSRAAAGGKEEAPC